MELLRVGSGGGRNRVDGEGLTLVLREVRVVDLGAHVSRCGNHSCLISERMSWLNINVK